MDQKILAGRLTSISDDIRRLNEVIVAMETTDVSRLPEKYGAMSVDAARRAEWIALRLRHLVCALPFTWKQEYLPQAADTMGIKIEQREGMYEITLPGLMPKRKSGRGAEYLIDPLMAALEQHVKEHSIMRFPHYMVCFVMVYDRTLSERRIRDYDNLELKAVLDAAAAYLMESDGGLLCDAYHSTELGETDCTRMFIMDSRCYPQWYAERQEQLCTTTNQNL